MRLIVRLTEMKAVFGWRALCLNVTLYFLCQGEVRSRPCASVSHPFSPEGGTVCLHHAGLPSTAVLLFHTLFIDHEKRDVFHVCLSLFNPIFVLVRLD